MMTSPHSDNFDPRPLPSHSVPLPTERTNSPNFDNFLDPLLSLTPDKPQGIGRVAGSTHHQRNEDRGNSRQNVMNKTNTGKRSGGTSGKVGSKAGSQKKVSNPVIASNPGVLFQEMRTTGKHKEELQKQLLIIKHCEGNGGTGSRHDARTDGRNKENRVAAKVNRLTKPSTSNIAHGPDSGQDTTVRQKSAISKSNARDDKSQSADGRTDGIKKHVRIIDPKCPLSSPALHSTAVLRQQLMQLQTQAFNAEEVVIKTLQESESARTALNERVAEAANIAKNDKKYSGLVSLGVPVDETLQRTVTQRMSRVKRRPTKPSKASEVPPPDILDMFSPSMIVESANLDVAGLVPQKVKPEGVDPDMTFDLYRHMQCWDLAH